MNVLMSTDLTDRPIQSEEETYTSLKEALLSGDKNAFVEAYSSSEIGRGARAMARLIFEMHQKEV